MKLIFLGTGSAMVCNCYNTCFLLENEAGELFLTDAGGGNGILKQMQLAGKDFLRLHDVFVTHAHTDHILGVIWVVRKVVMLIKEDGVYEGQLRLYGHSEALELVRDMCSRLLPPRLLQVLQERVEFKVMEDGDSTEFFSQDKIKLTAFDIHSVKTKQFGYRLELPGGKSLTCLGDEPFNELNRAYVEGTDWLLCEAYCRYEDRELFRPYEKNHSTVKEAAELATQLGAGQLVLYHTEEKTLPVRKRTYTAEAREYFAGGIFVPEDLEEIEI